MLLQKAVCVTIDYPLFNYSFKHINKPIEMVRVTLSLGRDKVLFLDPNLFFWGGGGKEIQLS